MLLTRALAVIVGTALPLTTAVALAPSAGADPDESGIITTTVDVTYTCNPTDSNTIGGNGPWTNQISVSYPESVAPGETFSVSIRPGQMTPVQARTGRVTYDIQGPANVTNLAASLSNDISGFNSGTPAIVAVSPTAKTTQAGTNTFRIWGGNSARWGTSSGTSTNSGLQKTSNAAFQLPTATFTMRAPVTPGAEVVFGLPGAGAEAATSAANAQFAYTRGTANSGNQVDCAVSANAAALTTTTVSDAPAVVLDSTTRVIGGDQTGDSSLPVQLQAQVAAPYATVGEISQGTVTFRDRETNLIVGTANPNAQGIATVSHQFPRIPDGDPDQPRTIIAEYSGVEGNISPSSDTIVLTLTEKPTVFWNTDFTVAARVGTLGEADLPVNVTATFARPAMNFPEGTLVQLYRDALPIGEPVAMPAAGTAITFPTDSIPRADRTGTHNYTVELVTIWSDYNEWKGATLNPAVVVVTGLDGGTVPQPPTGSVDLGSITSPITGSLSELAGYDVAPLSSPTVVGLLSSAS